MQGQQGLPSARGIEEAHVVTRFADQCLEATAAAAAKHSLDCDGVADMGEERAAVDCNTAVHHNIRRHHVLETLQYELRVLQSIDSRYHNTIEGLQVSTGLQIEVFAGAEDQIDERDLFVADREELLLDLLPAVDNRACTGWAVGADIDDPPGP